MKYLAIATDIKDNKGESMIFAINQDYVLTVAMRAAEDDTWVSYDLIAADQGLKAQVFGISQNSAGQIYIVLAAGQDAVGPSQLFIASALPNNPSYTIWQNFKNRWTSLHINPNPTRITEIIVDAPKNETELPMIVLGTTELAGKVPKYYRIKSEVARDNIELFPNLANANELIDIKPARLNNARGVYSLYRRDNNTVLEFEGLPNPKYNVPGASRTLTTPPGAVALETKINESGLTDLYVTGNGLYVFKSKNQRAHAQAEKIADDDRLLNDQITSRSSLTEDYRQKPNSTEMEAYPVYRTSISFPPKTVVVDLWASAETEVEINGKKYTIDPVKSAHVTLPDVSKLSVSLPANALSCPCLMLHTNLMRPEQRHIICPDVEAHKKIVALPDGALHNARAELGINPELTEEHLDHAQKAIQNLTQAIQYTYNRKAHGVHHDRAVLPTNMDDLHFKLDFSDDKVQYSALDKAAVIQHTAGAQLLTGKAAQDLGDDIENFFKEAGSIIVHTVEAIGHDIVDTLEHIGEDVVTTVDKLGEDLVHGDIRRFGEDLLQGGENIGRDLFSGVANVVGDVVSGAGQLVVVTLKLAGKVVQFILHNTGAVGEALGWLFEKIGAAVEDVIVWLLDKIGWDDVLHTHDVLKETINKGLDQVQGLLEFAKNMVDAGFKELEDEITNSVNTMLQQMGTRKFIDQPSPPIAFSGSTEKGEWLLTHFSAQSGSLTLERGSAYSTVDILPGIDQLLKLFEQTFGANGEIALNAFGDTSKIINEISSQPNLTFEHIISVFLEIAKDVALFGLRVINTIIDILIDLAEELFILFKKIINTPINIPFISDLYKHITKGQELTLLDFSTLLIAIPATLIFKAIEGRAPFGEMASVAASLPPEGINATKASYTKAWGICYGSARTIQGVVQTLSDISSAARMLKGSKEESIKEIIDFNEKFFLENWVWGVNLCITVTSQFMSSPNGDPFNLALSFPPERFRFSSIRRSEYITPVLWLINYASIPLSIVYRVIPKFKKGTTELMSVLDVLTGTVFGVINLAFYIWQDITDNNKLNDIRKNYFVILDEDIDKESYKRLKEGTDSSWQNLWLEDVVLSNIDTYNNFKPEVYNWQPRDDNGQDKSGHYYIPKKEFNEISDDIIAKDYQNTELAKYYDKPEVIYIGKMELEELHDKIGEKEFQKIFPKEPSEKEKLQIGAIRLKRDFVMFLKWAEQGGANDHPTVAGERRLWGIERKTFSYVTSALPSIGQFLTLPIFSKPTDGATVLVTAAIDMLFCMSEGITVIVRTGQNEYMY